jgi:hypothetical protein
MWWIRGPMGACFVLLALVIAGCSKPGWLETYPVKGVVRVDGKPAKDAMITFHPREQTGERPYIPTGKTNENGEFTLSTFVADDGAPAGEYDVTITWPVRYNPISTLWEGDKLKGRYEKKQNSPFHVTIEKKPQELPPFELSTTGSKK